MKIDDFTIMKNQYLELLRTTEREGMDNVITKLEKLGFFEAPAGTHSYLSKRGGLMEHSLNVYSTAMDIRESLIKRDENIEDMLPLDSVVIVCLLHDVCRADIYKPTSKEIKHSSEAGDNTKRYDVDYHNFPIGHGEKSVIVLLRIGLDLTDDEILAIRWHMNAWDLPFQSTDMRGNFNEAKKLTPLLTLLQTADAIASNIFEYDTEE